MTKIGLLSDTHGFFDTKLFEFFNDCDEIWHAGDLGSVEVLETIRKFKPLKAVYGNIDDLILRAELPEMLKFNCEETGVFLIHIGGYPGHYEKNIRNALLINKPALFICGHSHILKVMYDKQFNLLHINPGSAGKSGFHKVRTAVRFAIDKDKIKDLEVIELEKKHKLF
jgi:uncharacterized protein